MRKDFSTEALDSDAEQRASVSHPNSKDITRVDAEGFLLLFHIDFTYENMYMFYPFALRSCTLTITCINKTPELNANTACQFC